MSESYAYASDVEAGWRPLTPEESDRADVLARRASMRIRRKFPTLDARLTSGAIDPEEVAGVVAGMVQRAMTVGAPGVSAQQDMAGPFQRNLQFANPMGDLYLTADDIAVLSEGGSGSKAFSVDLTPPPVVTFIPI